MTSPFAQAQYQVRFDWGLEGAAAIADGADVIVVVDVLSASNGSRVSAALAGHPATVVAASLRNPTAVAQWVLERQAERGGRVIVAIVAEGEWRPDGSPRFAVEDLLGAGAVVDALAAVGIDHSSPEAAAASAAFTGLRTAIRHVVGASASARELADAGHREDVELAPELDSSTVVPVLGE